ncbi:hypothetical protein [Sphingobacterium sp. LRF_L2]|uniref:hypothetical protein n=1 Tax=Sphingobacterium sp. LRF_L2 TaxID=3369421 RepID=UPI003F5EF486
MKKCNSGFPRESIQFALFAANMTRLFPAIEISAYDRICADLRRTINKTIRQQDLDEMALSSSFFDDHAQFFKTLQNRPGMICTFHYGAYRLLARLLCAAGLKISLVMSKKIMEEQAYIMRWQFEKFGYVDRLEFIEAGSPHGLLKMVRAIRDGRQILIYIDGNDGVEKKNFEASATKVDFMGNQLYVRPAIASISYKLNIPLYPVLCVNTEQDQVDLEIGETMAPTDAVTKENYIEHVFQQLYEFLEDRMQDERNQWEGLFYNLPFVEMADGAYSQNKIRIWTFRAKGKYYIISTHRYRIKRVNVALYGLFRLLILFFQR